MPWQKMPLQSTLYLLIVEDVINVELMVIALEAACITFTYDTTDSLITCQQLQAKTYNAVLADNACLSSRLTKC